MATNVPYEASKIICKNLLLIARCMAHNVEKDPKMMVKRLIFDENIHMYFSHFAYIFVHDREKICKSGDTVLIRKMPKPLSLEVRHEVVKVLYPMGDVTDPITGRKCVDFQYRKDMKKISDLYGRSPDMGDTFDYDRAPDRGWQEGKKDFTHKEGYQKFHEFEPGHPLHKDPTAC